MHFQGVLFRRDKKQVRMEIGDAAKVREAIAAQHRPAVLTVQAGSLALFAEHPDLFENRRIKHSRKELAKILLGKGSRIPFIALPTKDFGRLRQSALALIAGAEKKDEAGIYILGVSDRLFQTAWEKVSRGEAKPQAKGASSSLFALLKPLPREEQVALEYWGESAAFHEVRQQILYAARSAEPVLILGETGTGKGIVARAIHKQKTPNGPFEAVNCAAIPGELLESELFGYAAGAFTGARAAGKTGRWKAADNGSLLLDEIGDLSLDHQAKILTAVQEKRIEPLGTTERQGVNARILAATSRSILEMVQAGRFRADLYYRLRNIIILTPTLRDHPEDIPVIASLLWRSIAGAEAHLPRAILDDLCTHRWPGNVRELRSVLTTLNTYFGAEGLTREKLRAVFQHYGLVAGYEMGPLAGCEPNLLLVDWLKELHRADEAMHACEEAIRPVAKGIRLTAGLRAALTRIDAEMQTVLKDRLFLGGHETYSAVAEVENAVSRLLVAKAKQTSEIACMAHDSLLPAIGRATERLFLEMEKLRASVGKSVCD